MLTTIIIALAIAFVLGIIVPTLILTRAAGKVRGIAVSEMIDCEKTMETVPYVRYTGRNIRFVAENLGILPLALTDDSIGISKKVVRYLMKTNETKESHRTYWRRNNKEYKDYIVDYMATAMLMPYEDVEQAILEGKTVAELSKIYGLPESIVSRRGEDVKFLSEIRPRWR